MVSGIVAATGPDLVSRGDRRADGLLQNRIRKRADAWSHRCVPGVVFAGRSARYFVPGQKMNPHSLSTGPMGGSRFHSSVCRILIAGALVAAVGSAVGEEKVETTPRPFDSQT